MTRWSGRLGMASCGEDLRATASRVRHRRKKISRAHRKKFIAEGVVCASLCCVSSSSRIPREGKTSDVTKGRKLFAVAGKAQTTAHWVGLTTLAVIKTLRQLSPSAARHVFHDAMSGRTAAEPSRGGSHARGHRGEKTPRLVRSLVVRKYGFLAEIFPPRRTPSSSSAQRQEHPGYGTFFIDGT